ncbi:AAA family ATPase [Luteolibacter flavescens]|uniref:AAA family ATPase n=1 Tax=Luteolibacter flavescens TaxID=1859460 RepID=A0ABT3FL89_9BACT|nr:AAA family ATPase [Luteolibacter flavescens]MCW1884323.1 AAA family ATPase [Luteolibacter flavescens]
MDLFLTVTVSLAAVFAAAVLAWRAGRASMPSPAKPEPPAPAPEEKPEAPAEETEKEVKSFHDLASDLDDAWNKSPTLDSFRASETLREAIEEATARDIPEADLLGYARRGSSLVAVLALEILADKDDREHAAFEQVITGRIDTEDGTDREHAFALLHHTARGPVVPVAMKVLRANLWKWDDAEEAGHFGGFLTLRRDAGESPSFGSPMPKLDGSDKSNLEDIFRRIADDLVNPLRDEMNHTTSDNSASRGFLADFARVLDPVGDTFDDGSPLVATPELEKNATRLAEMLLGEDGAAIRCPLLVGEKGSGKSALLRLAARRLQEAGFTVFEASGPDLVSGQCYLGDLEKRVRGMLRILESEKFVWLVPSMGELIPAGRTRNSETGVFDLVLPRLLAGKIRVLSEIRPGVLDKLAGEAPRLPTAMSLVRLQPPGEKESLDLAAEWVAKHTGQRGTTLKTDRIQLQEASQLAAQFFPGPALPGRLFLLLKAALHQAAETGGGVRVLDRELLLESIAATTGMPIEMLDDARPLDLEKVRELFSRGVMGQPEAVDTLVSRLAMMKAGLTDPTRPQGVFLFAGPTGTGKTELAKTLAQYLFGAPDRMLRIDMSELQSGNHQRLTGPQNSLASQIRQQPFSVVLLDEFEKADISAWDLFLQVFDDGRLTDSAGNTADFRHAIIILTSNLGAKVAQGVPLGFGAGANDDFRPDEIEKAVAQAFRPEFVNRIDRVLCFRPLSRETMRAILSAQLKRATSRRGLRLRPWVIDFDTSATEFLLEQGFSPTLGARPLHRAIDRHLLGPLAEAIVRGEFAGGEDLVFIYEKDGRLRWDLASDSPAEEIPVTEEELPPLSPRRLVLSPAGNREEIQSLMLRLTDLASLIELDAFHERRAAIFEAMSADGFWTSAGRFAVLGEAEYIDRIESAVAAARKTLQRVSSNLPAPVPLRALISKMALRIHLLEQAWPDATEGKPSAAWVALRPVDDSPKSLAFAKVLAGMIDQWAEARGMQVETLKLAGWSRAWSIEGFAALRILEAECGLHVGEEGGLGETARVEITTTAQPPEPASMLSAPIATLAAHALEAARSTEVVRRYQERPTPLVRDRRRGFRTGRLDLVLAGHFDLIDS